MKILKPSGKMCFKTDLYEKIPNKYLTKITDAFFNVRVYLDFPNARF
jgi:hypothetical protein